MSNAALTELAYRHQSGLEVRLLWEATTNKVSIDVVDHTGGSGFRLPVAGHLALYAFHHPYPYAFGRDTSVEADGLFETAIPGGELKTHR